MLGEALKTNSVLSSLNLWGFIFNNRWMKKTVFLTRPTANGIGPKGARWLGEALKINTTLITLDLHGEVNEQVKTVGNEKERVVIRELC